jgi:hypothetical protein
MSPARKSQHQDRDVLLIFVIRHRLVTNVSHYLFFGGEDKGGHVGSAVGDGFVLNPEKLLQRTPKP